MCWHMLNNSQMYLNYSTNIHWDLGQAWPCAGSTKTIWHGYCPPETESYSNLKSYQDWKQVFKRELAHKCKVPSSIIVPLSTLAPCFLLVLWTCSNHSCPRRLLSVVPSPWNAAFPEEDSLTSFRSWLKCHLLWGLSLSHCKPMQNWNPPYLPKLLNTYPVYP